MNKIAITLSAAALSLTATISGLSAHQVQGHGPMMGQNQPGAGQMMNGTNHMGPGRSGMMGPGMMMGHGMMRMMMIMMDTDGDGAVSLEEFQAVHARMFGAMDLTKDGKLTTEEIEEFSSGNADAPDAKQ